MQFTGYINHDGKKILLLIREHKTYRSLKIRKSGNPGRHMAEEEKVLNDKENKWLLDGLLSGITIKM